MHTLENNEDPDELHVAPFYQGLRSLLKQKQSFLWKLNVYPEPLDIYNEPFQVYCIKPEGRIH